MEQAYKMALEIMLKKIINDGYIGTADVRMICETALRCDKESEDTEC